ncbi:LD-carboxypeptidase [Zhouia spongiae]|uniref:LD-carboxypeptidase n=1 Tax=Zhouia spongiae TaxID=2202721 RepID=A0ABY3YNN1_9FLAO|nr:LD-carboxypeptidase [Zhouia spongiae]UNY99440.1 LD-carboxypeptidase [Zhouia spongiae]
MKKNIWITSTARKIDFTDIEAATMLLMKWGFDYKISKTIGLEDRQFAGTDDERAAEFQYAMDNPDIDAIWCARGGYGTVRIIDKLDFTGFIKNPKPIIGYSDVTVLHSHLHTLGLTSIHATMPINVKKNTIEALHSLKTALNGDKLQYEIRSSKENRSGQGNGRLVGGNLSILYSLLGSGSSIDTDGKILFLEDLDEYLYHIDRMFMNIKRNGYFDNLSGLVVGSFTDIKDNTVPYGKTVKEIIIDVTSEYNFPIVFDFPAGHIDDNNTLIMGQRVNLTVNKTISKLEFL